MIRLVACDLDGTLLYPDGRLPAGIFPMIRRLREKRIRFAAASDGSTIICAACSPRRTWISSAKTAR